MDSDLFRNQRGRLGKHVSVAKNRARDVAPVAMLCLLFSEWDRFAGASSRTATSGQPVAPPCLNERVAETTGRI